MDERYYTEELLEEDLREFEERYGLSSQAFYDAYCADTQTATSVAGHDRTVWATLYQVLCRLREAASPQAALHAAS